MYRYQMFNRATREFSIGMVSPEHIRQEGIFYNDPAHGVDLFFKCLSRWNNDSDYDYRPLFIANCDRA